MKVWIKFGLVGFFLGTTLGFLFGTDKINSIIEIVLASIVYGIITFVIVSIVSYICQKVNWKPWIKGLFVGFILANLFDFLLGRDADEMIGIFIVLIPLIIGPIIGWIYGKKVINKKV